MKNNHRGHCIINDFTITMSEEVAAEVDEIAQESLEVVATEDGEGDENVPSSDSKNKASKQQETNVSYFIF